MYTFCVNGLTRFVISSYPPGIPLWIRPFRSYSIFLVFLLVYLCLRLFSFLTFFLLFFFSCLYRSENTWHETSLRWPQLEMFTKALSIAIKNRSLFAFGLNDPGITKVLSFFFSFPTSVHLWLLLSTRFVSRYLVNANQISTVSKARCIFESNCERNRHRLSNFFPVFLDFFLQSHCGLDKREILWKYWLTNQCSKSTGENIGSPFLFILEFLCHFVTAGITDHLNAI